MRISGTPAVEFEKRFEMPKLRWIHGVQVVGSTPYCENWDVGGVGVWCGERGKWTVQEMEHKL